MASHSSGVAIARPAASRLDGSVLAWSRLKDAALVGGLVVLAVAVRLPYLGDIPRLTDEPDEIIIALQIARGQRAPLVNVDHYIGALWNYVLAGVFLVTGPSFLVPRLVALAFGALTVVPC